MDGPSFKKFSRYEWLTSAPQPLSQPSFLQLQQFKLRHHFNDGSVGPAYRLETVTTPCMDAVVIIIYSSALPHHVILRQAMRPAVACRALFSWPGTINEQLPIDFWELPAGGVERSDWQEAPGSPFALRARQETWEEVGIQVAAQDFFELGPAPFMASAFCPERIHFMALALPAPFPLLTAPPGDGHPMEQGGWAEWVLLEKALTWCRQGQIIDSKSEIGLRRLAEYLAGRA
jgi:ADP-ribose pyrophosphatase